MKIKIHRYLLEKEYTMGKLYINDVFICDTLEDAYRGDDLKYKKVAGQTCIPCGQYEVRMTESPKFKRVLPELINVPFFNGVRIHSGNFAGQETLLKYQEIDKTKQILDIKEYVEILDD